MMIFLKELSFLKPIINKFGYIIIPGAAIVKVQFSGSSVRDWRITLHLSQVGCSVSVDALILYGVIFTTRVFYFNHGRT